MNTTRLVLPLALALAATGLTGCGTADGNAGGAGGKTGVVVSFYPLQYLAEEIGKDHVEVTNLTAPGKEPHDLELTPKQVGEASKASLGIYEKGLQPDVDKAFASTPPKKVLDVGQAADLSLKFSPAAVGGEEEHADEHGHSEEGHADEHGTESGKPDEHGHSEEGHADEHGTESGKPDEHGHSEEGHGEEGHAHEHENEPGTTDPHFWLDPVRYAAVADAVAKSLSEADPAHKDDYAKNAQALKKQLTDLDKELKTGLSSCTDKNVVTSHAAFGYLTNRYGLKQVPISGLSPEEEPEPKKLAEIADFAKKNKVRTIYTETLVSPAIAQTVAKETGAQTAVLDPIEGITDGSAAKDYPGIMRANLESLKKGQACR